MDPEMISEQDLDEDILQCRAEIQRALGQDPIQDKNGLSEREEPGGQSLETAVSQDRSEHADILMEETASGQDEELIEDWIEKDEKSNSGSFSNLNFTAENSPEEKNHLENKTPAPAPSSPELKKMNRKLFSCLKTSIITIKFCKPSRYRKTTSLRRAETRKSTSLPWPDRQSKPNSGLSRPSKKYSI